MSTTSKLYYIENEGCDDTTYGLVRMSDKEFPKFKNFVENLNRNSTYGCKPKIYVYAFDETKLRKPTVDDDRDYYLYLEDEVYVLDDEYRWADEMERVV